MLRGGGCRIARDMQAGNSANCLPRAVISEYIPYMSFAPFTAAGPPPQPAGCTACTGCFGCTALYQTASREKWYTRAACPARALTATPRGGRGAP